MKILISGGKCFMNELANHLTLSFLTESIANDIRKNLVSADGAGCI